MVKKRSKALGVPLNKAEPLRRMLKDRHLLQEEFKIFKEGDIIFFPVKKTSKDYLDYPLVTKSFEVEEKKPSCYKDLLKLPKDLQRELPTSYDVIGSIILIKLPQSLFLYRTQIGNALLQTHRHIRTVCHVDPVSGELRTRNVTIISGESQTLTTHIEYGLTFHVDVATTYFSSRLASERRRIAAQVKSGETIVDLFTGVAPFSIMIARYAHPKVIYAVDKNPEAIILAKQNIKQNHLLQTIEVINADAKDVENLIPTKADRIIMNLPFSAHQFFAVALSIAAPVCKVHYYDIIRQEEIENRIASLKKIAQTKDFLLADVQIHRIKSYAPREFYIGLDITATKHADVA